MAKLDHPHILNVFEYFEDDANLYIVTELCTGGELFEKIIEKGNLNEREAALIMEQILSALVFCHDRGIVHRDLKPENAIFLTKDPQSVLKVIDFGTSVDITTYPKQFLTEIIGTVRDFLKLNLFGYFHKIDFFEFLT